MESMFNQFGKIYYEREKMEKLKDKPGPSTQDEKEVKDAFKDTDAPVAMNFAATGDIDTESEGVEVGLMNTEKFHFEKPGDRLVGFLKCRKTIDMGDEFTIYEVYNIDGDWSFSGSKLVGGRMEEVPDKCIIDITFTDLKMSGKRKQPYKNYKIKFYPWPSNVNPMEVRCGLHPDGRKITFIDFPSDLGATPLLDEEKPKEV